MYVEYGAHAGYLRNEALSVLVDGAGNGLKYNTKRGYLGTSVGIGKKFYTGQDKFVDLYGAFYYNHLGEASLNAGGNKYTLNDVNSMVFRLGLRYSTKFNGSSRLYYGGAVDYELDGKASGTMSGKVIRPSSLKGFSGMIEAGTELKREGSPWELDIGGKAFFGQRRSVMGSVAIKYNF